MKSDKLEVEAKFRIPDEATFNALKRSEQLEPFRFEARGAQNLVDRYLDTRDKRLFRAGYACRVRRSGAAQVLALKALTPAEGNIHRRREIEVRLAAGIRLSGQPESWPDSEIKEMVLQVTEQAPLETLFTLEQTRHIFLAKLEDRPVLEYSLDTVSLRGKETTRYLEMEAELLETGAEADLALFVDRVRAEWPVQTERQSKFERAWLQTIQTGG